MALLWPKIIVSLSSKWLWSAAKQLSISVNCFVLGSYISICLALGPWSGKYLANLLSVPSLQNAGCCSGARIRAVTNTRPWLSITTLRGSDARAQIFSVPQYGDAGVSVSIWGAWDGTLISVALFSRGSSAAMMSELWIDP